MISDQDFYSFCQTHLQDHPKEVWELFLAWHKIKNGGADPVCVPEANPSTEEIRVCLIDDDPMYLERIFQLFPGQWERLSQISMTGWVTGLSLLEAQRLVNSGFFSWLPLGTKGKNSFGSTIWTWTKSGWVNPEGWSNNPIYPVYPILPWPHV